MKFLNYLKILCPLLLISSCASYRASPLYIPSAAWIETSQEVDGVLILAKTFTREDCEMFFDRNILAEGYQPIQLYIQNRSDCNYIFSLNQISLPIVRLEEVSQKVHTSTLARAASYGAGALILSPVLAVPALVDGIKSSQANAALDLDFSTKIARDQIVGPNSYLNAVIFVPNSSFQDFFTVTLEEQTTHKPLRFDLIAQK